MVQLQGWWAGLVGAAILAGGGLLVRLRLLAAGRRQGEARGSAQADRERVLQADKAGDDKAVLEAWREENTKGDR